MLRKLAQKIAIDTCEIIGYDVIITDEKSIVIGASDVVRLGTFHEGSVKVIATGRPHSDFHGYIRNMRGTKAGFTIPIELNGRVLGSIGITGKRENVEKFGLLVKKHAEMILREEIIFKASILSERALQNLIQEIMSFNVAKNNEELLLTRGYELGYDLKPPHIAIAIDLFEFSKIAKKIYKKATKEKSPEISIQALKLDVQLKIKNIFNKPNDICIPFGNDKFIILHALQNKFSEKEVFEYVKQKCYQIISEIEQKNVSATIGIGSIAKSLSQLSRSCQDAWRVLEIGKKVIDKPKVVSIKEYCIEGIISNVNKDVSEWFISQMVDSLQQQPDWKELFKTIRAWCESGFSQIQASKILHIHRNTLNYRLEKIYQISGMDVRKFRNALALYLGVLMVELGFIKK
ncbi:CdaR family transcriptional regulator [Crassaminicella profunda]|uniref:CdaR family transcriptional regulator n=1 Tax=Crassaminicella profunda TaxID=1286698 RepID=UPI001CA77570|nr:sugar diacid recognition domain-containing protein [Crassaminicella profunda]QZY56517.1 helix-turn-helix domain-containing protein [Crassaminicella profunda]